MSKGHILKLRIEDPIDSRDPLHQKGPALFAPYFELLGPAQRHVAVDLVEAQLGMDLHHAVRCLPYPAVDLEDLGLQGEGLTGDALARQAARVLGARSVVPVHYAGWQHFTEGATSLRTAFDRAGLADRLVLLAPGEAAELAN